MYAMVTVLADIQKKLETAGFLNIETKYSYGIPGQISWKISMKFPITILNISKLFFIIPSFLLSDYFSILSVTKLL